MSEQWFSYDPDGMGFMFHDTEEQARRSCLSSVDIHEQWAADDVWADSAGCVCWGRVLQRFTETERRPVDPEEDNVPDFIEDIVDMQLMPAIDDNVNRITPDVRIRELTETLDRVIAERAELRRLVEAFGDGTSEIRWMEEYAAMTRCRDYNRLGKATT